MKRLFCAFAAWVLLVGLTGPAQAQYTYTALDVPGATATYGYGINDAGQIVGVYFDMDATAHGFLLDVAGSYTTLDVPGAVLTWPLGINDAGQIVGMYRNDPAGANHAFVRDVDGSYTMLDVPGAYQTVAYGIDASGQIVGVYVDAGGGHGFLATPGG